MPLEAEPWYVAAGGGAVWVGSPRSTTIQGFDAATNKVTAQIQLSGDGVSAITADDQAVWVEVIQDRSDQGQQNLASLVRIDSQTKKVVATIPLDGLSGYDDEIAIGAGAVWVAGVNLTGSSEERGADLVRIDPTTNAISVVLPASAFSVGAGADTVWVTSPADGVNDSLHKPESWVAREIDPTTNKILAPIPLPRNVSGVLAATADGIWFSGYDDQGLLHPVRLQAGAFDASVPPNQIRIHGHGLRRCLGHHLGCGDEWAETHRHGVSGDTRSCATSSSRCRRRAIAPGSPASSR